MHKLMSGRNLSNDSINKNHHYYQHQQQTQQQQQQQQQQNKTNLLYQTQLQPPKSKQKQQQEQQQQRQQKNNLNVTKLKEVNSYEKYLGSSNNSMNGGTIKSISDIQPSKVKMSGYLKKKRTKVGGWRKMWFVLQNQLLLSYSSKENYDKKLVSFKDVLNLVPGTTIHSLGSFRFAIETTTNVMYNFRCDDSQSYNAWINAIIESLSLNLRHHRSSTDSTDKDGNNGNQQKFKNSISLDNIQRTASPLTKIPIKSCNSSDSISRFNLSRMPNIPIADATAKILQRNGIPSTSANNLNNNNEMQLKKKVEHIERNNKICSRTNSYNNCNGIINSNSNRNDNVEQNDQLDQYCDKQERAKNFRLHEKRLSSGMPQSNLYQSDEVSRINRMFSRSRSANNVTNQTVILHQYDTKNSFVSASTAQPTSTTCSSIINIVNNPNIVSNIKSVTTSKSGTTSVGIATASIISLKEGYGSSLLSSSSRYSVNENNQRKYTSNSNGDNNILSNSDNQYNYDRKFNNRNQKINWKINSNDNFNSIGVSNNRNKNLDTDGRYSNRFFPVNIQTTCNNLTKDNKINSNEIVEPIEGHINCNKNNTKNSSIKYKMENNENNSNGDNNDINNHNNHNSDINSSSNNENESNENCKKNDCGELRDLNQNRMFNLDYEKIGFELDKDDADDAYECYPLQQKMQDLNICKHQQHHQQEQEQQFKQVINGSEIKTPDRRQKTDNHKNSPLKKSISLERETKYPFYSETEYVLNSMNHLVNGIPISPHQSLQNFSQSNSPVKDEFSISSTSTTTSNSRCNSSLVTTESTASMTNSPTNDEPFSMQQQKQQNRLQYPHYRQLPKVLDSRIHPALQPSDSMEDDLHMVNIFVRNDGDGESHTDDVHNIIIDDEELRPASAQCLSNNTAEPIYALVDLKGKHARRAKLRELQDQLSILSEARDRDRPRSLQCISSDYEEVLNFESMQDDPDDDDDDDDDDDENENIYEPINIPEYAQHRQQHNQRHALWKYFRRINIESLLEMARHKKIRSPKHSNISKYESSALHPVISLPVDSYCNNDDQQTSPFSDIRRKLGNHRKSIKLRMKRFYNRHDLRNAQSIHTNAIIKERNAFSDDELDSQGATGSTGSGASENSLKSSDGATATSSYVFGEIDKYRRSQKQFFGSLTRMKKTRTSISLEEDDVKTFCLNGSTSFTNNIKPWLSPKLNRSEEKVSKISKNQSNKNDNLSYPTKSNKN